MAHVRPMIAEYAVLKRDERVLLLWLNDRSRGLNGWHLPGGRLEENEGSVEGLCREIREEIGFAMTPDELRVVATTFIDPERLKYVAVFVGEAPDGDVLIEHDSEGKLKSYAWMDRNETTDADFVFPELKGIVLNAFETRKA